MLTSLSVKNYALIEALQIEFGKGFTAITGETGAGKSILLGALALVLGKRADSATLRDKNKKCIVEADFNIEKLSLQDFFYENDLDYENIATLRREILPTGKSRAFVNDTPVSLNIMKRLGEMLVDVHSQHQTLLLSKPEFQTNLFDSYINNPQILLQYQEAFNKYKRIENDLKKLMDKKENAAKEEDYLRYQLSELENASETIDNFDDLKNMEVTLAHAEEIAESIKKALFLLSDSNMPAIVQIASAKDALSKTVSYNNDLNELYKRLEPIVIELKDIVAELELTGNNLDFNPALIDSINEKLDNIYRLQKKHNVQNVGDLQEIRNKIAEKLNEMESVDTELETKKREFEKQKEVISERAARLSLLRKEQAPIFEKKVKGLLSRLGMPHAQLKVKIQKTGDFTLYGSDKISFLFSANKGMDAEEISKVASGGEFSRLMLALKAMIRENSILPTIIFDEIDSGISGEIAGKTGTILKEMSEKIQVIAITHLPQIAAKADIHIKVFKETTGEKTSSNLKLLSDKERVLEIAKLISDKKITKAAMETAETLLNN
jgi:DNA repair protein RecN (Recombination protein N)